MPSGENVVFRASETQRRAYGAVARSHGVTLSAFIRTALDQTVKSLVETGRLQQQLQALS